VDRSKSIKNSKKRAEAARKFKINAASTIKKFELSSLIKDNKIKKDSVASTFKDIAIIFLLSFFIIKTYLNYDY